MRIVVFNDTYNQLSGAETYFRLLADLLERNGNSVACAGFGKENIKTSKKFVYRETSTALFRFFWRITFNPMVYFSFRKWIKQFDPDVIHLCNINKYTLAVLLACRGYKVIHSVLDYGLVCPGKYAVNLHNMKDCPSAPSTSCWQHRCLPWYYLVPMCLFFNIRKKLLNQIVQYYITESSLLAQYLENYNYYPVSHRVLGIELEDWPFNKKEQYKYSLLYVGFLEKHKGVLELPKILKLVREKGTNCKLKIIGDGSLKNQILVVAKQLGVDDKIEFIGRIELSELKDYYRSSDLLLVPSLHLDNAPLVIMQAMASGTPIVGFKRGGIPWQIGDGGEIAIPNDVDSFAEKVITYYLDSQKWIFSSQAAHNRAVDIFNAERNVHKILELY